MKTDSRAALPLVCLALTLGACAHAGGSAANGSAANLTRRCAATLAAQNGYQVHQSSERLVIAEPPDAELSVGRSEVLSIRIHTSSDGATAWTTVNDRTLHEWRTKPVGNSTTQRMAELITRSCHSDAGLP